MANIYEDLAAAAAQAQEEIARTGKVSDATAFRMAKANAAVAEFEAKINSVTRATGALYQTFTTYNKAVTDGVKGFNDLASTTDQVASSIEALSAALAFILPIGRLAKIAVAGLGLLAGELTRSSKAIGEQLDGLKHGFNELAQVGGTTAGGLTNMFEIMQKFGLSAKDFPTFAKELAESSQILASFGASVSTGTKVAADLAEDLKPMRNEMLNFGITLDKIGSASLGFIKTQRLMSIGTNANLDMGRDAMMKYTKELDTLTRLTGISRSEQEKIQERAMSNAVYAATIDDLAAQNKIDEMNSMKKAMTVFASLGPKTEKGFQDLVSGIPTSEEAVDLMLATGQSAQFLVDKILSGRLNDEKLLYDELQKVARDSMVIQEQIGRNAAQMGTSFGTTTVEIRNFGKLLGVPMEEILKKAEADQNKTDPILKKYNNMLIRLQERMEKNQNALMEMSSTYIDGMDGATGGLNKLTDAALKAAESLGLISSKKKETLPPATSRGVPTSGSALGETKGGIAGPGAATQTSMSAPPPGSVPPKPEQAPQMAAIRELIAGVESKGDYNVAVGGKQYPLTDMTIAEVMKLQKQLKAGPGSAMGKYQVIYSTLVEAISKLGIGRDQKFDPETQDRIADYLIMKRGFAQYSKNPTQEGKERFLTNLASEWAGLPAGPDNKSRYAGVGNNKANIDWTDALQKFANGGILGAGKIGIAGEKGPELIAGPATVSSNNDIMSTLKDMVVALERNTEVLENINRNTSSTADTSDRMLRLSMN